MDDLFDMVPIRIALDRQPVEIAWKRLRAMR